MIFSGIVFDHPYGYRTSPIIPILRGEDFYPHCFFVPCIILRPPHYLRGMCGPHLANNEKRHLLCIKFWRTLKDFNLWNDEKHLQRKEERTVRDDKRDIIPNCIITVSFFFILSTSLFICTYIMYMLFMQEICRRYPSMDGNYSDYKSTFDAENLA